MAGLPSVAALAAARRPRQPARPPQEKLSQGGDRFATAMPDGPGEMPSGLADLSKLREEKAQAETAARCANALPHLDTASESCQCDGTSDRNTGQILYTI